MQIKYLRLNTDKQQVTLLDLSLSLLPGSAHIWAQSCCITLHYLINMQVYNTAATWGEAPSNYGQLCAGTCKNLWECKCEIQIVHLVVPWWLCDCWGCVMWFSVFVQARTIGSDSNWPPWPRLLEPLNQSQHSSSGWVKDVENRCKVLKIQIYRI